MEKKRSSGFVVQNRRLRWVCKMCRVFEVYDKRKERIEVGMGNSHSLNRIQNVFRVREKKKQLSILYAWKPRKIIFRPIVVTATTVPPQRRHVASCSIISLYSCMPVINNKYEYRISIFHHHLWLTL